jgi:hypothetical protein
VQTIVRLTASAEATRKADTTGTRMASLYILNRMTVQQIDT